VGAAAPARFRSRGLIRQRLRARTRSRTVSDSSTTKRVAARCPAGKRVLGGGGAVVNGAGQVVLQRLQPTQTATDDRFVVGARERRHRPPTM
jgi:hypothetical protein